MHCLMLITLTILPGESSRDARNRAFDFLLQDDSFCGEGGRFGSPLCDWFVIGGRWSGRLHASLLGQPYEDAFAIEFPELAERFVMPDLIAKHQSDLNQFWRRFGGRDTHPLVRSTYERLGFDDDAMPIDQALYDHFLQPYEGEERDRDDHFADLDGDPVDESFIGRKWLVVVDYHS